MHTIDILLIEDNEGDILLTTEALKEGKFSDSIHVVKDGWEALKFLQKKEEFRNCSTPDLILLDINLPKLNGHEVLKRIKTEDKLKHIPVIMLSTSSSGEDVTGSYKNQADCYITKPIDADDFTRVVAIIKDFWFSIEQVPKIN